jgi:hypothetical protein
MSGPCEAYQLALAKPAAKPITRMMGFGALWAASR